MMKVFAPNKNYTGVSATVGFANGVGETDDEHLLKWFKRKGYRIEGGAKTLETMTLEELKTYAKERNIELGKAATQEGIIKKIEEADA